MRERGGREGWGRVRGPGRKEGREGEAESFPTLDVLSCLSSLNWASAPILQLVEAEDTHPPLLLSCSKRAPSGPGGWKLHPTATVHAQSLQGHPTLSLGFLGQEYWSGSPFPLPGDLLDPGIEPTFSVCADSVKPMHPHLFTSSISKELKLRPYLIYSIA